VENVSLDMLDLFAEAENPPLHFLVQCSVFRSRIFLRIRFLVIVTDHFSGPGKAVGRVCVSVFVSRQ